MWNSLRPVNEPGAHSDQSEQLLYTIDRSYGAGLTKCLSGLVRQSDPSGALRLSRQRRAGPACLAPEGRAGHGPALGVSEVDAAHQLLQRHGLGAELGLGVLGTVLATFGGR